MGAGNFITGLLQGNVDTATKMKKKDKKGIFRQKPRMSMPGTGSVSVSGEESDVPEYKRGGRVRKTGLAKVHKGERVLTKRQAKNFRSRGKGR